MTAFRHIRFRRQQSLPSRAWRRVREITLDLLAVTLIARRFWRHRPPLLHR